MGRIVGMVVVLSAVFASPVCAEWIELYDMLMQHTFKIEGNSTTPGKKTYGTVFLVGRPDTDSTKGQGHAVMVTAAHVFYNITGNKAKVYFRKKESTNHYSRVGIDIPIRQGEKPLWVEHPEVDVAAMYISVPDFVATQAKEIPVPSTTLFASDVTFELHNIHPGEELLCLGFPYGTEANKMGFPILRSGKIASFPLIPAKEIKSFLFDFEVFGGNSGGPVFLMDSQRRYGRKIKNEIIQYIVGLVSLEKYGVGMIVKPSKFMRHKSRIEIEETRERLGLAIVIPSAFIQETIEMLEKPPIEKNSIQHLN